VWAGVNFAREQEKLEANTKLARSLLSVSMTSGGIFSFPISLIIYLLYSNESIKCSQFLESALNIAL